MTVAVYIDHHIRSEITDGLRDRGVDCLTAAEDGHAATADDLLLARALFLGRIMPSMDDEDMLTIATAALRSGHAFAGLIYGHQRRVTIGQVIADVELLATYADPAEVVGRVTFLPLQ